MIADYDTYDALGLAELVRKRDVSAAELLEECIARVERLNPPINAIVTRIYDRARAAIAAGLPDGPFTGVPFALKELLVSVEGAPSTNASRLLADFRPPFESEIVRRYKRAGLVIFAKTNSSEFGIAPAAEPKLFGVTRNPWDLTRSSGGSSGGSAAAVAAGLLPAAHATDGGGSIRIPAACCGLFGLKPTRARITLGPEGGEGLAGLSHQHAVTRSVRDSAALLDAVAGPLPGDPYLAPPPERPYVQEVGRDPGKLRIAFTKRAPSGVPIDPDCVAAVEATAKLCASLGHEVVEASPEFDYKELETGFFAMFCGNTIANIARITGGPLPPEGTLEGITRAIAVRGQGMSAADYVLHLSRLHRQSRRIAAFFTQYDIWLTPTLASPARPLGDFDTDTDELDRWLTHLAAFIPFTFLFNVTGQPAMSVPLTWNAAGLPVGSHFVARYGEEGLLFRLAAQLEAAQPWFDRRPPSFSS